VATHTLEVLLLDLEGGVDGLHLVFIQITGLLGAADILSRTHGGGSSSSSRRRRRRKGRRGRSERIQSWWCSDNNTTSFSCMHMGNPQSAHL